MELDRKETVNKMKTMTALDKAMWLEEMEVKERAKVINLMTKDEVAEVFRLLPSEARAELLEGLSDPEIVDLIERQESDDLVDVLQEMPANLVTNLLKYIPKERRETINRLLQYPEESVGSLMSIDFVTARTGDSKEKIIKKLQESTGGHEHLNQIYIMDESRHLIGFIHLSDLVKSDEPTIDLLIHYSVLAVDTHDDQETAADLFRTYQLLSLPVHDSENRLVGVVTADDIFEVISEEIHEDYLLKSGVSKTRETKETYLETSVIDLSKGRIKWLLVLMISATLTAYVIQSYEAVLASSVALAAYIPMLMDGGGNSGTQASTLGTRALSLGEIESKDFLSVIWKETRIGFFSGFILAVVNAVRMLVMDQVGVDVILTVSLTLLCVITLAKAVGGALPLLAVRFNQDPAVMAGPLITTIIDTLALIIYFQTATLLLNI